MKHALMLVLLAACGPTSRPVTALGMRAAVLGLDVSTFDASRRAALERGIVATGAAVTVLAHLVYRPWSLDGGRVESRPLADPLPTLDLGIAWSTRKTLSDAERKFIDYLKADANSAHHS